MIGSQLLKSGLILVNLVDKDNIKELKGFIQQLLDQGTMKIELRIKDKKEKEVTIIDIPYYVVNVEIPITPLVIEFPAPFTYEDVKVIPWIYQPRAKCNLHCRARWNNT